MALTRPRYSQIPDSDYKNSCRIVTTTNVTLTSGALLTYDGVTLVQYDRVLVAGQTDKTQNGIYSVSTLGSGSNGTWVRSKDANANDRLTAGMNTFVEEGTYTGQFWHLLTPGPIVLGVTELIFGQITGNAAGTSSQVQYNLNGSIAGAANLKYDSVTGNVLVGNGRVSTSSTTGALTVNGGIGVTGNINAGGNVSADKFYTTNGLFWAANGLAFSSGLEVSEINAANALSNISTSVTAIRFDKDTGFSVNELNPGNIKISLGSSFKTWHVPGQADLVAAAEDEVTFFGNGIDITTNPTFPKSITFISNNSILEANIGAFYNYANANIGTLFLGNASTQANIGAFYNYANANIGTLFLGNASTQANIGAFYNYANANIGSIYNNLNTLDANVGAFKTYANIYLSTAATFTVTNAGAGAYIINSESNPTLYLIRGQKYNFSVNASGHPFWIKTTPSTGTGDQYNTGVVNNGDDVGLITFDVPLTAPDVLYYICQYHSSMVGQLRVVNFANIDANIGTLFLGNASTNANLGAFYNYANTKIGTNTNSNLVVRSTTDSVSAITGALVVAGGAGIAGNLYVAGNIYASNLTAINISTLSVTDPLLYLTASNPFPYNYDIGFFSHYAKVSGDERHTGLARDYTTEVWNFFSNVSTGPGVTVNWAEANLIYDTVRLGDIIVSNTTQSTSTTSGALTVAGGAGIAGALYITNTGDVSANIGSIRTQLNTLDANIGSYEAYANIYLGISATFVITNSGSTEYVINGESNPVLYLIRGQRYNFSLNASGHPFWIKTAPSIGVGDQYNTGVFNNGDDIGTISFEVSLTAPDVLYYVSQFDAAMTNELRVVNFPTLEANIGTLFLSNTNTQANLGAFQTYTNTSISGTQANLGSYQIYANANIGLTSVNFAAFASYANTKIGNNSNGNLVIDATTTSTGATTGALVVKGGVGVAGNVYSDKFYTTSGVYWSGNNNPYSTGGGSGITYTASTTPPVSPAIGDQWYDTVDGILYEYMNDGDTNQWVDIISPTFSGSSPIAYDTDVTFGSNITVDGNIYTTDGIFWSVNGAAYSTGGGGSFSGSDDVLRANVGAYQIYANANIGTLYLGNISTQANLGAFQIYANANLGAFQTYANTTFTSYSNTNVIAYLTQGANIGSGSTTSNLVAAATTTSSSTTTGALVVRGGMGVAGTAYFGGITRITDSTASTNNVNGALVVTGGAGIMGALNVGTTGTFSSGAASTTTGTGALIVAGGVGIGGALNVSSSGSFGGLIQTTATTAATSTSSGALYVAGGVGIVGNLHAGGNVILGSSTTTSNVVVTGTRTSTTTTTGALVVRGGAGIVGNVYTDKVYTTTGIFWSGNNAVFAPPASPIFSSNIVAASGTSSTNTTTGALVVIGGVGVSGTIRVGSEIYVANNINVTNSAYIGEVRVDSTVDSANVSTGSLRFPNGGGIGLNGNIHTKKLYTVDGIYWSGNSQPFTVEASNTYGSNLVAASGTASTNTTTGAVVVAGVGGLGVGGDLNATAGSTVAGWTVGGLLWAACTTPATSAISGGGFLVNGGARLLGNVYASGNVILGANTSSNVVANATTTSTSTTTGALVVRGGAGVGGNLYVGSEFVVPGGGKITSSGIANFLEKANIVASSPSTTVNVDLSVASVMYWTSNATANITANIRGDATTPLNSVLAVGQSVTTALFIPNGVSNYYVNSFKIDNTTVTPAYSGNTSPALGNPDSIDIYSFTILKTADATYKVFATQSQFQHPG